MPETTYATPADVLLDAESDARRAVNEHARYIEEAYALPEKRALVLALAQFGAKPKTIVEVLDVSERMVRQHWTLIHSTGVEPQHYYDVFGTRQPSFSALGTLDDIWPWPWTHAATIEYDDPDVGTHERKTIYSDSWFGLHGADYLVVQETTHAQPGYDKTERIRYMYSDGEQMARHLSSNAETPWEYEASAHLIELAKGDANGEVSPEEVLGISYEDLPTLEGTVYGPHAEMVELFTDTNVTLTTDPIDWDYVRSDDSPIPPFEVRRGTDGLEL